MQCSAIGLIIVVNVADDNITVINFGRKSTVERGLHGLKLKNSKYTKNNGQNS